MLHSRYRRLLRRLGPALAVPVLTSAAWLMAAGPAAACSCAMPGPMSDYAAPDNAVFSGRAGALDGRGVPVEVDTWYHGTGAAPLVYLAKASFGDGASCGVTPPVPGSGWIWVTWLPPEGGDPQAGLCSPSAQLGTPEGDQMVADATATFGGAPPPGAPTGPLDPAPSPSVPPEAAPLILAGTLALGALVFAGVFLLGRRRTGSSA